MESFINIITEDEAFEVSYPGFESSFTLRRLSAAKLAALQKKHTDRLGVVNQTAYMDDVLDYAIQAWKGIRHPMSNQEVECTRAHKMALPKAVRDWLASKVGLMAIPTKEDLGNLPPSLASGAGAPE